MPYKANKAPLVIAQHGGGGTPELCSDMNGKNNYSNFTKIALEHETVVFAPQLLLWNNSDSSDVAPNYQINFNRADIDNKLKHFGSSITALEIYCIRRSVDYIESLDCVDSVKLEWLDFLMVNFSHCIQPL